MSHTEPVEWGRQSEPSQQPGLAGERLDGSVWSYEIIDLDTDAVQALCGSERSLYSMSTFSDSICAYLDQGTHYPEAELEYTSEQIRKVVAIHRCAYMLLMNDAQARWCIEHSFGFWWTATHERAASAWKATGEYLCLLPALAFSDVVEEWAAASCELGCRPEDGIAAGALSRFLPPSFVQEAMTRLTAVCRPSNGRRLATVELLRKLVYSLHADQSSATGLWAGTGVRAVCEDPSCLGPILSLRKRLQYLEYKGTKSKEQAE